MTSDKLDDYYIRKFSKEYPPSKNLDSKLEIIFINYISNYNSIFLTNKKLHIDLTFVNVLLECPYGLYTNIMDKLNNCDNHKSISISKTTIHNFINSYNTLISKVGTMENKLLSFSDFEFIMSQITPPEPFGFKKINMFCLRKKQEKET